MKDCNQFSTWLIIFGVRTTIMTVSPDMQRYAAEIYRLQRDHEQVSLSLLSSHLDASAQAISTMVKRLNKNGFLVHEPYRGVRLTPAGEKIAMPALRRHRLTEVFLVKVMEYDRSEEHTSELQSPCTLVCRLLLEKK